MPKLFLVDFDRTLLKPAFYTAYLQLLTAQGHLAPATAERLATEVAVPNHQLDFLQITRDAGLNVAAAIELVRTHLHPDDYLYPDVPGFLERHQAQKVVIMTTGNRQWQIIKLDFCPTLRPYPKIILADNKGEYIRDTLMTGPDGVSIHDYAGDWFDEIHLIDDRTANLTPLLGLPHLKLWHIQRPDAKHTRTHDHAGVTHITSLAEVK